MFENRSTHPTNRPRSIALECLEAGVTATLPARVVPDRVSLEGTTLSVLETTYDLVDVDRVLVVGGGKASGGVAQALESIFEPALEDGRLGALTGVVVSSSPADTEHVEVRRGDHPTPTERNHEATQDVLELAETAGENDLVLAAITGGASALLTAPANGITVVELATTTDALLESGASIDEINAVRKHCSAIKGGQLARAATPATVVTLAISDVVGDDPSVIGSGPTVLDPSTFADARAVCRRYGLGDRLPSSVRRHLDRGVAGDVPETPNEDDSWVSAADWHCLAGTRTAIEAAEARAQERGYRTCVLSSRVRGEAADVGRLHGAMAAELVLEGDPIEPPAVVLSGGEVTVSVADRSADTSAREPGVGGPNQELVLASALEMHDHSLSNERGSADGTPMAVLASIDTDGIDGPTDACGGIVDDQTFAGRDEGAVTAARAALERHDAYTALEDLDSLLETGYTGTNVNDVRVLVVDSVDEN